MDNLQEFTITFIDTSGIPIDEPPQSRQLKKYTIIVTVDGDASSLVESEEKEAYIAFSSLYKDYANYAASAKRTATMFYSMDSNSGCATGMQYSPNLAVSIPSASRVGFCDGLFFGIGSEIGGSRYAFTLAISVPTGSRGLASLFSELRKQDWVIYKDSVSGILTLRRGSTHFTDVPIK
ncbi:MAG: hypothetical protein WC375_12065, partial [Methanomassiliicoccales archaeon]